MLTPWRRRTLQGQRGPERFARGGLARYVLVILVPLALLPLGVFAVLAFLQARANLEQQTNAQLASIAALKERQITQWVAARRADINNLVIAPDLLQHTQSVITEPPESSTAQTARATLLTRLDGFIVENSDFVALVLADAETGRVVLATTVLQQLAGESILNEPYFTFARQDAFVASPRLDPRLNPNTITIVAAAPIFDPERGSLAVLVGLVLDTQLQDIIAPIGLGLGTTGRAYAVTGDGYEIGTREQPASVGIQTVMEAHTDGLAQYANPVGQEVFGAYRWIPTFGLAVLVEQDTAEALLPLTEFTITLLIITAVTALVSLGIVTLFTRTLTRPIQDLTDGAQRLAGGTLGTPVVVRRTDELGQLANAFNQMAAQLSELYQGLEQRIADRTRQLATAAEVARIATATLQTDELLARTVELIQERFGYYQISIFLLDEAGENAVLREAIGPGSAELKASRYQLAVGSHSLIGWVTANRKSRIAANVADDTFYLRSELLPDTQSEAAIPLRLGERVIGALDVQSRAANAFQESDLQVLQILADQIAVGVENGRLFARQSQVVQLEQLLTSLIGKIHQTRQMDTILETTATELGRAFGAQRAVVRLRPMAQAATTDTGPLRLGMTTSEAALPVGNGHPPESAATAPVAPSSPEAAPAVPAHGPHATDPRRRKVSGSVLDKL